MLDGILHVRIVLSANWLIPLFPCSKFYIVNQFYLPQSYQKALVADPSYKLAAECLAVVLTDIGTSLKLAGNTQEGIQKYHEAIKTNPNYAVSSFSFLRVHQTFD